MIMEVDQIVKGILDVRKQIQGILRSQNPNPVALSQQGVRLVTWNAELGDKLGELEYERETMRAAEYLSKLDQEGQSATSAENFARAAVAEATGQLAKLKIMHRDAANMISMVQSHLKVMENESRGDV